MTTAEFSDWYHVSPWTARRWAKQGHVKSVRVPPGAKGRLLILDPKWNDIDTTGSSDPNEWLCLLRQCDVAKLLGVTPRWLRYLEVAGKAKYPLVGHRKLCSIAEVRRLMAQRQIHDLPHLQVHS